MQKLRVIPAPARIAAARIAAAAALLVTGANPFGWTTAAAQVATPTAVPSPPQTWEVQVGATAGSLVSVNAYGPDPVIIRAGDTVSWKWVPAPAPHTVTFWAGKPALAGFLPGPGIGDLTLGPANYPVGAAGPNIRYDGASQLSSGIPFGPPDQMAFNVTFTQTGLFAYVCTIHPGMRGSVEVREAGAPLLESPAQAKARGQVTLGALGGSVKAQAETVKGTSVGPLHTVSAGVEDGFGASAVAFLPGNVRVARGDWVVWTVADPMEIHTVTFVSGDAPPDLFTPLPQSANTPGLVIKGNVAQPSGGFAYSGTGLLNSGILFPGGSAAFRMDAPPGTYSYLCLLHPDMKGTITVTG